MSDTSQGAGWWMASDGKWYPPELWTGPPNQAPAGPAAQASPSASPGQPAWPSQSASPHSQPLPHSRRIRHNPRSDPAHVPGARSTRRRRRALRRQRPSGLCRLRRREPLRALRPAPATEDERAGHCVAGLWDRRVLVPYPGHPGDHLRFHRTLADPELERRAKGQRHGPRRHHRRVCLGGDPRARNHAQIALSNNDNNNGVVASALLMGQLHLGGLFT